MNKLYLNSQKLNWVQYNYVTNENLNFIINDYYENLIKNKKNLSNFGA